MSFTALGCCDCSQFDQ